MSLKTSFLWRSTPLLRSIVAVAFLFQSLGVNVAIAQVMTKITADGTLPTNSVIAENGNVFDISAGTSVGGNLFHSFQDFHVGDGDTANFVDPGGIANILSRVTGGNVSNIFGQLRSDSSANLFFLNPNGVVFGPNSSLDVGGSFHVSTANHIRLGQGSGLFSASNPANDVLVSAPPAAFGFLGNNPPVLPFNSQLGLVASGGISIHGLTSEQASSITILARDSQPSGQENLVEGIEVTGTLISKGGNINLASVAASGEVPIIATLDDVSLFNSQNTPVMDKLGSIQFEAGSTIDSTSKSVVLQPAISNGAIHIQGGTLRMMDSQILAEMNGDGPPLFDEDGQLVHETFNANPITLNIQGTTELDNSEIRTSTEGIFLGSGNIRITTSELNLKNKSHIRSTNIDTGFFPGKSGDILLMVDSLELNQDSTIDNRIRATESPQISGSINIHGKSGPAFRAESITLDSGLIITGGPRLGAGDIQILAKELTLQTQSEIRNSNPGTFAFENDTTGIIDIKTGQLDLKDGSKISSVEPDNTLARSNVGKAPLIKILADESINIAGQVRVNGEDIRSQIVSITQDNRDGGDIDLSTPLLIVEDHGLITTESSPIGALVGDAGNIFIKANKVELKGGAEITSNSSDTGNAGSITLNVDELTANGLVIDDSNNVIPWQARITSDSTRGPSPSPFFSSSGNAGTITIQGMESTNEQSLPAQNIVLDSAFVRTATQGEGNAGAIKLHAQDLTLQNGTLVAAGALGSATGNAGGIDLQVDRLTTVSGGLQTQSFNLPPASATIASNAFNPATSESNAGQVSINGKNGNPATRIDLEDTAIRTTQAGGGLGGNITVSAELANLSDGTAIQADTSGTGNAGSITLNIDELAINGDNDQNQLWDVRITSDSLLGLDPDSGNAGEIAIRGVGSTPEQPLPANQVTLNNAFIRTGTVGGGNAGAISVVAHNLSIENGTLVAAGALGLTDATTGEIIGGATGDAGGIRLEVDQLTTTPGRFRATPTGLAAANAGVLLASAALNPLTDESDAGSIIIQGLNDEPASLVDLNDALLRTTQTGGGLGGSISITSEALSLSNATSIQAGTTGSGPAGNVIFNVGMIEAVNAEISSSSLGGGTTGNAGSITTQGAEGVPVPGAIVLTETEVTTTSEGMGEGGAIVLASDSAITLTDSTLSADVNNGTDPTTEATGSITLTTPTLTITGGGVTAESLGTRAAGDLTINVDQLTTHAGSTPLPEGDAEATTRVQISSSSEADGRAGNVVVQGASPNQLATAGPITLADTDITTEALGTGEGGAIVLASDSAITLTDSTLSADVTNGLDPTAEATGSITLTTPALTIAGGGVTAESLGTRAAGDLTINVDQLTTHAGSTPLPEGDAEATTRVQISSSSEADGRAGNVVVQGASPNQLATAGPITLADTDITTEALGTGEGGAIVIASDNAITLTDSTLSADVNNGTDPTTEATGSITLTTPTLTITGGGVTAESLGTRAAGDLTINVDQLTTHAGSTPLPEGDAEATTRVQISSSSEADGRAGNVVVQGASPNQLATAGPITLADTDITTEALGTGAGGDISVLSFDKIELDHTTLSANVTNLGSDESTNTGADIALVTPALSIVGGGITAESTGSRIAGNIGLATDSLTTQEGTITTIVGRRNPYPRALK